MKWFNAVLVGILIGLTVEGIAQNPPVKPAPPATSSPATLPARDSQAKEAPSTTAGAQVGANDTARYIIGSEDTLQVTGWKEPTLSGTFPVRPDGMISLVLVGDLPAAGRTPMQLGHDITLKLNKYCQEPRLQVVVLAVNRHLIY